jgi:hypothetical protein
MNGSIIIGKLEVLDLGWDKMSWVDAMKLAEELGRGYRLPCPSELRKLYPNLAKTDYHWTDYEHWLEKHIAYSQHPMYHKPEEDNKENLISVILVRDISDDVILELLFDSF